MLKPLPPSLINNESLKKRSLNSTWFTTHLSEIYKQAENEIDNETASEVLNYFRVDKSATLMISTQV